MTDDHYSGDYFSLLLLCTDLKKKYTHTRVIYTTRTWNIDTWKHVHLHNYSHTRRFQSVSFESTIKIDGQSVAVEAKRNTCHLQGSKWAKRETRKREKKRRSQTSAQSLVHIIFFTTEKRAFEPWSFPRWARALVFFVGLNEATRAFNGTKRTLFYFFFSLLPAFFLFLTFSSLVRFFTPRFFFPVTLSSSLPSSTFLIPLSSIAFTLFDAGGGTREPTQYVQCFTVDRAHVCLSRIFVSPFQNSTKLHSRK